MKPYAAALGQSGTKISDPRPFSRDDSSHRRNPGASQDATALVESHLPLVASMVDRVWVSPRLGLTRDDLLSAGAYGLLLAARRFDPTRGIAFGVFARSHIRRAILREINQAKQALGFAPDEMIALVDESGEPDMLPDRGAQTQVDAAQIPEVSQLMEYLLTLEEGLAIAIYFFERNTLNAIAGVVDEPRHAVVRRIKDALE